MTPWLERFNFVENGTDYGRAAGSIYRVQKLVLVWVVRYFEWITWLEEELQLLYSAPPSVRAAFQILVFVTQPGEPDPDLWVDA